MCKYFFAIPNNDYADCIIIAVGLCLKTTKAHHLYLSGMSMAFDFPLQSSSQRLGSNIQVVLRL